MVEVQNAVRHSLEMLGEIFPPGGIKEPRLEEVTLSDDEAYWMVTVSFSNPDYDGDRIGSGESNDLTSLLGQFRTPRRRVTKTIKLRADDGAFVGMKSEWN